MIEVCPLPAVGCHNGQATAGQGEGMSVYQLLVLALYSVVALLPLLILVLAAAGNRYAHRLLYTALQWTIEQRFIFVVVFGLSIAAALVVLSWLRVHRIEWKTVIPLVLGALIGAVVLLIWLGPLIGRRHNR